MSLVELRILPATALLVLATPVADRGYLSRATIRAPLAADGTPKLGAATEDGAAAAAARKDKEATYPDLLRAKRCELVVAAIETGGRWDKETADFVHELAQAKSREAPPTLRKATSLAWERRWVRVLSVSSAAAFAHSLTAPSGQTYARPAEVTPELHDLLASGADGGRWDVQSASQGRPCTFPGSASPRSSWAGCTRRVM